jgi:hypothetical protein
LIKAYMMAHTSYLTGTGASGTLPSNSQGYGMPTGELLFGNTPRILHDQSAIFDDSGETWQLTAAIADPAKPVRIALAYTDQAGAIGVSPQVNNLDLEAVVGGTTHLGNVFDGQWSTTGGSPDANNNYEAVFVAPGASGAIEITVTAFNITGDGVPNTGDDTDQDFALVCSNCALDPTFTLVANPREASICSPDDAVYSIEVGSILGFSDPVDLAVAGNPAGTSVDLSTDPVNPPGISTLTIGNTAAATHGSYEIEITGSSTTGAQARTVDLRLDSALPTAPTLMLPADGAIDAVLAPSFEWTAAAQAAEYNLQLASDPGFVDVVYEAMTATNSHTMSNHSLDPEQTYFWRVSGTNECGQGPMSAVFSFTTLALPPVLLVDDDDNSPDVRSAYTDALDSLGYAFDVWDTNDSNNEPSFAEMAGYSQVIWFTGDSFGGTAGPGDSGETALASYLEAGGCLFLSSQDYHWDQGLTPFMQIFLGVASVDDDTGEYTSVEGMDGSVFEDIEGIDLSYSGLGISDYSDDVTTEPGATLSFMGNNSNGAAVEHFGNDADWQTQFLVFPWEAIASATDREEVLLAFLESCLGQNQDPIFSDGFETGGTGEWSRVVP